MKQTVAPPPNAFGRLKAAWRQLAGAWDRMAIYLPLLMMGLLALGTYWLARNNPGFSAPETAKEVRHEIDYFMKKFSVRTFDETGRLKSEIFGDEGRHFPDTDILEIDQARIRSLRPDGSITVATGNRAYTNGDASEVQLTGNARVVRDAWRDASGKEFPRLEFRGEFLHAFLNEERVTSHKPVVLTRGLDQFTGDTFDYDNLGQVANLKGRVRGVLVPRAAPSSATPKPLVVPDKPSTSAR
jgi:lipopolysaccharide export system protein LptC